MTSDSPLLRVIGPVRATALVVGTIIGTGVFLKPAAMASALGDATWVLLAWITAALLSIAGALTYAELGARLPAAGGEYAYLRTAWGPLPAFFYGWMRFTIGAPGSIASFAVGAVLFLGQSLDTAAFPGGPSALAVTLILVLTGLNLATVKLGATFQTAMTILKVVAIAGLAIALLGLGRSPDAPNLPTAPLGSPGFSAFVTAVLAALWAFDGWNNLVMVGSEIDRPKRNIPLALIFGMAVCTALYLLADRAYFAVLDIGEVAAASSKSHPVATAALEAAVGTTSSFGPYIITLMSTLFVVSALGAMTGSILTGARVPFAMARDGLFFSAFARVSSTQRVPAVSILTQGLIASALAVSGTFDQLTDAVVFSSWIFYGLSALALFKVRQLQATNETASDAPSFRVPLYPVLPIVFVVLTLVLLINTIATQPGLTALGLGVLALGLPVYAFLRRSRP